MTVEYLAKATTDLRAVGAIAYLPEPDAAQELPVPVEVLDEYDQVVFRATIRMWMTKVT